MTDERTRIEGSVAAVLNLRELVINKGSDDGVTMHMKFAVLNRRGMDIKDPETGEILGSIPVPKVLVQVVRVQEKLSVARTFRTRTVRRGGMGIPNIFSAPEVYEVAETLRASEKRYVEELSEEESYIKVGDPVVQELTDEFESAVPAIE